MHSFDLVLAKSTSETAALFTLKLVIGLQDCFTQMPRGPILSTLGSLVIPVVEDRPNGFPMTISCVTDYHEG
jgi:hypothetical protein